MQKPNEMMDLVCLLSATGSSVFESKGLLQEFLKQEQRLQEIAKAICGDDAKRGFLAGELSRGLENLRELQELLGTALLAIEAAEATMSVAGVAEAEAALQALEAAKTP